MCVCCVGCRLIMRLGGRVVGGSVVRDTIIIYSFRGLFIIGMGVRDCRVAFIVLC